MKNTTIGTVIDVKKQWWLKINTKPVRTHAFDGAIFPHVVKISYSVNGVNYIKRKWIPADVQPPSIGAKLNVTYDELKPNRAKV